MTSDSAFNYTYDYNNNMVSSANISTGAVTTYDYDTTGQRIKTVVKNLDGSLETTLTPFKTYSIFYTTDATGKKSSEKVTKYIYANEMLIAIVNGTGQTTVVQSVLTDHPIIINKKRRGPFCVCPPFFKVV